MLSLVVVLKGLAEFAGLLLLGQGLVYLLSFGRHDVNPVYRFMRFLTSPLVRVARLLSPGVIVDRHVPAVAFFLVALLWVALTFAKVTLQLSASA